MSPLPKCLVNKLLLMSSWVDANGHDQVSRSIIMSKRENIVVSHDPDIRIVNICDSTFLSGNPLISVCSSKDVNRKIIDGCKLRANPLDLLGVSPRSIPPMVCSNGLFLQRCEQ